MNWRKAREYRLWRIAVIRKDKRCVVCGSIKHRQAHHLNNGSYFKEERFDVDNGVVLKDDVPADVCRGPNFYPRASAVFQHVVFHQDIARAIS